VAGARDRLPVSTAHPAVVFLIISRVIVGDFLGGVVQCVGRLIHSCLDALLVRAEVNFPDPVR
jgi:hypothetical protein